jgi:hypothetical protein
MLEEQWVWVPGYEGRYEVSSLGRVRSYLGVGKRTPANTPQSMLYVYTKSRSGYKSVRFFKGKGKFERPALHTLVATAFHGPRPFPNAEVRHLDGVAGNCAASNLVWGTRQENERDKLRHGRAHGPRGERHGNAKLTVERVKELRQLRAEGWLKVALATRYGVSPGVVARVLDGTAWKHVEMEILG